MSEHETIIEQGLHTFVEVSNALMSIRDKQLYRAEYETFEEYCRDRWAIVASRARQLIGAAEVVNNIKSVTIVTQSVNDTLLPQNEAQARPLTKLPPKQQPEAWKQAADTAPDGKITAKHVAATVLSFKDEPSGEMRSQSDLKRWLEYATRQAGNFYSAEIERGEYNSRQVPALGVLNVLQAIETKHRHLSNAQLALMHHAFVNVLHAVLGYETFEEYLDSYGIDISDGRLNNLYNMATNIIPWCEAYGVEVAGQPVDIWWFTRIVQKKSIASRTRHAVSTLLNIIKDTDIGIDLQKQAIAQILTWINDTSIGNKELRDAFSSGGVPEFGYEAWITSNGDPGNETVYVQMTLTRQQYNFLKKRLAAATHKRAEQFNWPALIIKDGHVTLNPDCFVDLSKINDEDE